MTLPIFILQQFCEQLIHIATREMHQFLWNFQRAFKIHSIYQLYPLCELGSSIMLDVKRDQDGGVRPGPFYP